MTSVQSGAQLRPGTVHVYCCGAWCGSFSSEADAQAWLSTRPDCDTYSILDQVAQDDLLARATAH